MNLFRPPTTQKKMPKVWVGFETKSWFPPHPRIPPWNQLTAENRLKNATEKPAHFQPRDPRFYSSKKTVWKSWWWWENAWQAWLTPTKCVKIHSGVQLGVAERLVTFGHSNLACPLWLHTKKMAETDLSKTEVGTRICCGGKAGGF